MNYRGRETAFGMAMLIGTGVLWGTIGPVSKQVSLISDFDAVSISWLRAAIASPVCLIAAWMTLGSRLFRASRRDLGLMITFGVVLIAYQWLYLAAIDRVGVTTATLVSLCGSPVIVALLSALVLHEEITRRLVFSLVVAIIGVALLIGQPQATSTGDTIAGVTLALTCALFLALHALGMRSLARRVHPLQPLAIGFPVGAIAITPLVLARGVSLDQPAEAWFWLAFLGIVPSSIAYLLFQQGLTWVAASIATIVTMIEPFVATVLAWIFFDERLGVWGFAGGLLLIASIGVLSRQKPRTPVEATSSRSALVPEAVYSSPPEPPPRPTILD